MNDRTRLDLIAAEILALEAETFAIADYTDVTGAVPASASDPATIAETSTAVESTVLRA